MSPDSLRDSLKDRAEKPSPATGAADAKNRGENPDPAEDGEIAGKPAADAASKTSNKTSSPEAGSPGPEIPPNDKAAPLLPKHPDNAGPDGNASEAVASDRLCHAAAGNRITAAGRDCGQTLRPVTEPQRVTQDAPPFSYAVEADSYLPSDPLATISRETREKLAHYVALLEKWQARINLVSPSTLPDAWNRHIRDSAQLSPLIPPEAKTLYDLGSGAGFPGLVLAILHPALDVHLVESDSKKCAFLQAVSRETGTPVTIHNSRIEKLVATRPGPDIVTARALAPLDKLLGLCAPWIGTASSPVFIFPKGAQAEEERIAAARIWDFAVNETASLTAPQATILRLDSVRRR